MAAARIQPIQTKTHSRGMSRSRFLVYARLARALEARSPVKIRMELYALSSSVFQQNVGQCGRTLVTGHNMYSAGVMTDTDQETALSTLTQSRFPPRLATAHHPSENPRTRLPTFSVFLYLPPPAALLCRHPSNGPVFPRLHHSESTTGKGGVFLASCCTKVPL